jgi:hypothetical protein
MASRTPKETKLDADVTKPSTTAPGDGPADTTDPNERAVSVPPQPGDEAVAVGTVNAVKPAPNSVNAEDSTPAKKDQRVEKYKATRPDGTEVTVTHNIDTGETSVS